MPGCHGFLRYFLVISNLAVATLGLLLLAGGVWLQLDQNQVEDVAEKISNYTGSEQNLSEEAKETFNEIYKHDFFDYFLIGIGGVTFLVSLFGFCGAKKESVCFLSFYIFFTILLIILQVSAIAIINIRDSNINHYKSEVSSFFNLELEKIEGSHRFQTIFFGVSTGLSIIFLLVSLWFCRSTRKPEGHEGYQGYQTTLAV